jgi:hypothetical protein
MRLPSNTWAMLLAICLSMTWLAWLAHGQVAYAYSGDVPAIAQNAVEQVALTYALYGLDVYEVAETESTPETILVSWAPIAGTVAGLSYCTCWGHAQNAVVLDSGLAGDPDTLFIVALHEFTHIILRRGGHYWGSRIDVLQSSTFWRATHLSLREQRRLWELYSIPFRPVPPKLAWSYTP